jgi:hypothetical protein
VWGVGCGVWGVGCGVWGVGCGVWGVRSEKLWSNLRSILLMKQMRGRECDSA